MAERKSFLVYLDWEDILRVMSNEQKGELFSAMFAYIKRGEYYDGGDQMVEVAFAFVRATFDRDEEKYQERCARNALNGQKGGRPRKSARDVGNLSSFDDYYD
ncbi:MAG: DUF6291 domain-containing protein [Clostridiales bacterium]|nr:DUF6291 domain-containing protein [Clostridiales bacterium]